MKYITKILIILSVILLSNFFYGVKISNADDSVGDTMEGANSFIEDGEKQIKKGQVCRRCHCGVNCCIAC